MNEEIEVTPIAEEITPIAEGAAEQPIVEVVEDASETPSTDGVVNGTAAVEPAEVQ